MGAGDVGINLGDLQASDASDLSDGIVTNGVGDLDGGDTVFNNDGDFDGSLGLALLDADTAGDIGLGIRDAVSHDAEGAASGVTCVADAEHLMSSHASGLGDNVFLGGGHAVQGLEGITGGLILFGLLVALALLAGPGDGIVVH